MKQITEELHIRVDYIPNDYLDDGDDWELHISVNDDCVGPHNLMPFGKRLRDLTVSDIVKSIKEAIEEELFDGNKIYEQCPPKETRLSAVRKDAANEALAKAIGIIEKATSKEGLSAGMVWSSIIIDELKKLIQENKTEEAQ